MDCFLESSDDSPRNAVHILFANEKVKAGDLATTADISESERAGSYQILKLESLVRMKLTSFRIKDRMHLIDMIQIGLLDQTWPARFSSELAERLQQILDNPDM